MKLGDLIAVDKQYHDSTIELYPKDNSDTSKNKNRFSRAMGPIRVTISIAMLGIVAGILAFNFGFSEILSDLRQLSLLTIGVILTALVANALAATFRFKTIAADIGYPTSFRGALATVSTSNLAGVLFFQIAGQLIARGVIAGRGGIPFAAVVVITTYERVPAAIVSALFALGGAFFIFGSVYLDRSSGGAELIKIMVGLIAATAAGALMGYGRIAAGAITPLLTRHFVRRCLTITGLTLLVHIPMQAAYVLAAHALSPQTSMMDLIAASAIVMFATSVPISFAGWGMREMSAVVGLGAIGVPAHAALMAAVIIGVGSLLVVGILATISLPDSKVRKRSTPPQSTTPIDYYRVLAWVLPIGAATLVLFQIYIPIGTGLLNVNLADPLAIVGGALFILNAVKNGEMPRWRASYANTAIMIMTLALAMSLLIGGWRFGWTSWAWINRFLGWFVLLSYGATAALAVMENGRDALRIVLLTFAGATAAIAGIEICFVLLREAGVQSVTQLVSLGHIKGLSQNRNSFALQLLMATSVTIVFARGAYLRIALLALFFAAFWFTGSRSGWIAAAFVIAASLHLGTTTKREAITALIFAASVALVAAGLHFLTFGGFADPCAYDEALKCSSIPIIIPSESSTQERLVTIVGGLKLFLAHPIFGAGLGAFRNEWILRGDGIPLTIHSTAVWLLAELGIVGFLTFAIPALFVFVTEWRSARKDHASALIVLCFVAFAVTCGPGEMLYQRTFWFVVGAALAFIPMVADRGSTCDSRRL